MSVHGFHPNSNRVTLTMSPSYPVNMSKIWGFKKYHTYFVVFTDNHSWSVTFGSFISSMSVHGFQPNSNRVTPAMSPSYPVNMSKIWGFKIFTYFGVFTDNHSEVYFESLITSMSVHGFQPNLTWSIPTVPSFIPVNISKIWGFKNFTFVLNIFFFTRKITKYNFYTMCTNYLRNYHKNGLSHLMRH